MKKPKILCIWDKEDGDAELARQLRDSFEVVEVSDPLQAMSELARKRFDGLYIAAKRTEEALRTGRLIQTERILEGMPDGVALLDTDNTILWANGQLRQWVDREELAGENFYACLGNPEILGPDFCPFSTALALGRASSSMLLSRDGRYYHVHAAPVCENGKPPKYLIVSVRDETEEMLQKQKLTAIHKVGADLADLTPEEVFNMEVEERIDLLKSNILHHTKDLFKFDVVEIRLLDETTGELAPLLSVGIDAAAAGRPLYARPQNNGVSGFVAATGKSYLCEDAAEDPLYLEGFKGARSSLTVPLILHDHVIGTFNVESPEVGAFTETDRQFLEIFSRAVGLAINTLELLVAQKATAAQESVEAIHSAVALPVDEILNNAVNVMERYIGHEPDVVERLQRILRNARDIKQMIQKVGRTMTPAKAVPLAVNIEDRPKLRGCRVLVADADERVRNDAHALLERYGCVVETAHYGNEAIFMVRNSGPDDRYGVIIADVRLPDMTGYDLLIKLQEILDPAPLVLMTGYGYDPGHSIVKARQAGLHAQAVLYKPFRLDQLLETVEAILDSAGKVPQA